MVETDDVGATPSGQHGTADCYLANTSAFAASTLSGNSFVYGLQGEDASGLPEAWVGRFTAGTESATGGTGGAAGGSITNGITDGMYIKKTSDGGYAYTGSYIVPDPVSGRFTIALDVTGTSYTGTEVIYIIDANRAFWLMAAGDGGVQDGDMRTQQQSSYSGANLNNNFVLYWQGYGYQNGSVAGYGSTLLQGTGDGAGNITVNQSYDDNNGTYAVGNEVGGPIAMNFDSSNPGRVWFSTGSMIYMYFFNNNNAFFLMLNGGGNSALDSGWLEPQTQTTFTNAALAGDYLMGKLPLMEQNATSNVGEWDFDSANNVTGATSGGGKQSIGYDVPVSGMTYSWLSTTYGTFSATNRSCAVINSSRAACISNSNTTPLVIIMQQ